MWRISNVERVRNTFVVRCFVWKSNGHLRQYVSAESGCWNRNRRTTRNWRTRNDAHTKQSMQDAETLMLVCVRCTCITKKRELRSWEWHACTTGPSELILECTSIAWCVTGMRACTCIESNLLSMLGHDRRCRANTMRLISVVHTGPHKILKNIHEQRIA